MNSGGIRKVGFAGCLLVQMMEWGTEKTVPLDPPDGLQLLDVRLNVDVIELLVRSPSFKGGEYATWETAEWWLPAFRTTSSLGGNP